MVRQVGDSSLQIQWVNNRVDSFLLEFTKINVASGGRAYVAISPFVPGARVSVAPNGTFTIWVQFPAAAKPLAGCILLYDSWPIIDLSR